MGLVDYSDSESSDAEPIALPEKAPSKPSVPSALAAGSKKPAFQKLVSHSGPGGSKIIVNFPGAAATVTSSVGPGDEPPAKRARIAGAPGASRFSNIGSFLPPPKRAATAGTSLGGSQKEGDNNALRAKSSAPRPGVHLKTGAEPSFSRENDSDDGGEGILDVTAGGVGGGPGSGLGLSLPPSKNGGGSGGERKHDGPTILEGMRPADEVKLVGKPLMFRPLSVARKPGAKSKAKKKNIEGGLGLPGRSDLATTAAKPGGQGAEAALGEKPEEEAPKKKISLFAAEEDTAAASPFARPSVGGGNEPLFPVEPSTAYGYGDTTAGYNANHTSTATTFSTTFAQNPQQPQPSQRPQTLASLADHLNLTPAARRELFGRGSGGASTNKSAEAAAQAAAAAEARFVNFDMEREYAHNEKLRASGEQVVHNPVRSIAPGKHNLRQMVNMVQNNASALEEHFASGRANQRSAAARYGWK